MTRDDAKRESWLWGAIVLLKMDRLSELRVFGMSAYKRLWRRYWLTVIKWEAC